MTLLDLPNLLLYSIPIAAILVYLPYLVVATGRFKLAQAATSPLVVLAAPRSFNEQLPAYAQRANWAHQNGFESFTVYTPAALIAYVTGQTGDSIAWVVMAYLLARALFPVFYILNIPPLRSLMFGIGTLSISWLYWLSCRALWLGVSG